MNHFRLLEHGTDYAEEEVPFNPRLKEEEIILGNRKHSRYLGGEIFHYFCLLWGTTPNGADLGFLLDLCPIGQHAVLLSPYFTQWMRFFFLDRE